VRRVAIRESEHSGIVGQREFAGKQILMYPDVTQIVSGDRTEGQRTVAVTDDRYRSATSRRDRVLGNVEDQPIGGIHGVEVQCLHIRIPPQSAEHVLDI
jgi:hypothetical protein